jgi:DNA-binding PadR family transcriptional regulator
MIDLEALAFVKKAKNRKAVLEVLHTPRIPSEIVRVIYGRSSETFFATVSRALRELEEEKLIEIINPQEHTGRLYRLTPKGVTVRNHLLKEKISLLEKKRSPPSS